MKRLWCRLRGHDLEHQCGDEISAVWRCLRCGDLVEVTPESLSCVETDGLTIHVTHLAVRPVKAVEDSTYWGRR